MAVIDGPDLAIHLGVEDDDPRAAYIAGLVSNLIDEKWLNPIDPPPTSVFLMALEVGARGYASTPGRGQLESLTRSFDDSSRTERFVVPQESGRGVVYLTDEDLAVLNGTRTRSRVGSIRLRVPGYEA